MSDVAHRRIVTGLNELGQSTVISDGVAERAFDLVHTPGMANELIWSTDAGGREALGEPGVAPGYVPAPGETRVMIVQFPPDSVFMSPTFDPALAGGEQLELFPGFAELFELDAPGFHRTPSIDYFVVLSGELQLELDTGTPIRLSVGDVVVQQATRHAWRNDGEEPAVAFVVLVGVDEA